MQINEKVAEGDKRADKIIKALTAQVFLISSAPIVVSWAALVPSISASIISIGQSYGVKWTRDQAWHFIRQCFLGGGFWCAAVLFGYKFCVALLQSTGIGYLAAYGLDASLNTAAAYAIGYSSKLYFREFLLSQRRLEEEEIFRNFITGYKEAKNNKRFSRTAGIVDQRKYCAHQSFKPSFSMRIRRLFSSKKGNDVRLSAFLAEEVNLAKRRRCSRKRRKTWFSFFF